MLFPVLARSMSNVVSSPTMASSVVPLALHAQHRRDVDGQGLRDGRGNHVRAVSGPKVGVAVMGMDSEPATEKSSAGPWTVKVA